MKERAEKPFQTAGANADDAELVQSFQDGNALAFDRLVMRYQDMVMNLCVRYLGNREDGEEAAQDTFVKAYKGLRRFKGEAEFSTWLYRIALNTCRNMQKSWWRKLSRRSVRLDAPVETETGEEPRELRDTRMMPEKDLKRAFLAAEINRALKTLAPKHRELVIFRDIQDMSYEEIEKITGISPGTVKSRLSRARTALQKELKDCFYE